MRDDERWIDCRIGSWLRTAESCLLQLVLSLPAALILRCSLSNFAVHCPLSLLVRFDGQWAFLITVSFANIGLDFL